MSASQTNTQNSEAATGAPGPAGAGSPGNPVTDSGPARSPDPAVPSTSPRITSISWGQISATTDLGTIKDAKLWPGGGRAWDWGETGTRHSPGIQVADVEELLAHGATVVVLSRGMEERLGVPEATVKELRTRGVEVHVAETKAAVGIYNGLVEAGKAVGGLFHSTC